MSLESIAARQKASTPADATGAGRGAGARWSGQRGAGRLGIAGRGNGGGAGLGRGPKQQGGQPQQAVAAEQSQNGNGTVAGGRKMHLTPADMLSMSLDQIQKRRRGVAHLEPHAEHTVMSGTVANGCTCVFMN